MAHLDDPQTQKANLTYIRSAMKEPILEREQEKTLAIRWKDKKDERALHELIRSYTRLVVAMASKFKNYGLPLGDLIQEGNVGLMQAAERFEPERDVRFSTYASWWIRSAIQDYVLRNWSIVRTGTTAAQKSLFFNLRRLRNKIESANDNTLSTENGLTNEGREKIAKQLNVNVRDVETMESRLTGGDQSLNKTIKDDTETEWQNMLTDENQPNPEDVVIELKDAQTRSAWLEKALMGLSPRERKIISDRHLQYETVTLEALGNELGISKERVRQLEQRAMSKLKTSISDQVDVRELFSA